MTSPQPVELTPVDAARKLEEDLELACHVLNRQQFDAALDAYARALGLALQLGPAATERVLGAILRSAQELAHRHDAEGLAGLGPMVVDLVHQVRQADALPSTTVMEAWATVAADLGALIGQVGLALSLAPDHREALADSAHFWANLLDDTTGGLFDLSCWFEQTLTVS
jgi:hypothetical protein